MVLEFKILKIAWLKTKYSPPLEPPPPPKYKYIQQSYVPTLFPLQKASKTIYKSNKHHHIKRWTQRI